MRIKLFLVSEELLPLKFHHFFLLADLIFDSMATVIVLILQRLHLFKL
jgi:hypothetical protein